MLGFKTKKLSGPPKPGDILLDLTVMIPHGATPREILFECEEHGPWRGEDIARKALQKLLPEDMQDKEEFWYMQRRHTNSKVIVEMVRFWPSRWWGGGGRSNRLLDAPLEDYLAERRRRFEETPVWSESELALYRTMLERLCAPIYEAWNPILDKAKDNKEREKIWKERNKEIRPIKLKVREQINKLAKARREAFYARRNNKK